jgi:hypothetical protein
MRDLSKRRLGVLINFLQKKRCRSQKVAAQKTQNDTHKNGNAAKGKSSLSFFESNFSEEKINTR